MGNVTHRRSGAVLLAGLLLATLVGSADTHAVAEAGELDNHPAALGPKPDLFVTAGRVVPADGEFWTMRDRIRFNWRHETKNSARTGTGRSPESRTWVQFGLGGDWTGMDRDVVPALDRGDTHSDRGAFVVDFTDPFWEYGTYGTRICADGKRKIAERNERNNCRKVHPFYLVPTAFEGSITGTTLIPFFWPGVTLSWQGTVEFDVRQGAPRGNSGRFEYRRSTGRLTFTMGGGAGGCTFSGTGRYTPSTADGFFQLDFGDDPSYTGGFAINPNFHFIVTRDCGHGDIATIDFTPSPFFLGTWLDSGPELAFRDPGVTRLKGDFTFGDPRTGLMSSHWDLAAKP